MRSIFMVMILLTCQLLNAQNHNTDGTEPVFGIVVSTFAGNGIPVSKNGTGIEAGFNYPTSITGDVYGNLYVTDFNGNMIRKIGSDGVVSTLAGTGKAGAVNGNSTQASFNGPAGIAVDASGNVFVADQNNHLIRKISTTGTVTTFAGNGKAGLLNGNGIAAAFNGPCGIALDLKGNLYVADQNNKVIRKITPSGDVTTLAGSSSQGYADGKGIAASFTQPYGIAVDMQGNVFVADRGANNIRKITTDGQVTTFAGSRLTGSTDGMGVTATFKYTDGLSFDEAGNLYLADEHNHKIRKISPAGEVSTYAGSGKNAAVNGDAKDAGFNYPTSVFADTWGNLFVADASNNLIRKISKTFSPEAVLNELKEGNNRFLNDKSVLNNQFYKQQLKHTKYGQHPHAVILSCLDSRIPPEIIFDQGIGNIFVGRVAGNISDANMLGSLEFATKVKHSKLLVVMGHSNCGAVQGAIDNVKLGSLTQLVNQIVPAIPATSSSAADKLIKTAKENVKLTIQQILNSSPVIKELVDEKEIMIVGAYYDVETGVVTFL